VISQTPNGFFWGKKWVSSEETLLNAMKYLKNRYFQCLLANRSEFCCSSLCPNNFGRCCHA
jgi:hypothetical protein